MSKFRRKLSAVGERIRRGSSAHGMAPSKVPVGGIFVHVQLMKATGLVAGDGTMPSPVIRIECGEEKVTTKKLNKKKDTINPEWFTSYKFGYKQKIFPQESIRIKAYECDKSSKVYGSYDCPLKNLIGKRKTDVWFPLLDGVASKARVLINLEVCERPPTVIYNGELQKQGGAHGGWANWQTRWFVLTQDAISYYESQECFERGEKAKGVVLMNAFFVSKGDSGSDGWEFTVHSYPKSVRCRAISEEVRQKWIDILLKPVTTYDEKHASKMT